MGGGYINGYNFYCIPPISRLIDILLVISETQRYDKGTKTTPLHVN